MIGHSMGGMVGLIYAGTFPDQVSALVVLDGVTVLPNAKTPPAHERIAKWIGQLDRLEDREPRRYRTIEEAAAQMRAHNKRLPPELAQHLAAFGVRRNADGTYSWKFDPYQRAMAPQRLSPEDHVSLWSRITCPTLLLHAEESFLARLKPGRLFPECPHRNHIRRGALAASRQAGRGCSRDPDISRTDRPLTRRHCPLRNARNVGWRASASPPAAISSSTVSTGKRKRVSIAPRRVARSGSN